MNKDFWCQWTFRRCSYFTLTTSHAAFTPFPCSLPYAFTCTGSWMVHDAVDHVRVRQDKSPQFHASCTNKIGYWMKTREKPGVKRGHAAARLMIGSLSRRSASSLVLSWGNAASTGEGDSEHSIVTHFNYGLKRGLFSPTVTLFKSFVL